ncbi:L-arabinose transport system permease protein AraQ [subsurface metagenome]
MRNKKISHMIRYGIVYLVVILGAITFLIPLAWMFLTSLKIPAQIYVYPPEWIPNPVKWENYLQMLTFFPFFRYLLNTLYITSLNVIGVLVSCSLVAYGITHIRWPGRNIIFILVISVLIIPYVVTLIPLYLMYHRLGWVGSYKPLWVASFFGVWAFHTFLLRQFFLAIPMELSDAAKIDGCSEFRIYWNIVLPLSRPALFAVALFEFLWTWNDFLMPLVYLTNQKMYTLSLGLAFFQGTHDTAVNLLMGASSLVTIPVLILFFFTQRSFIEGITLTGLKG